MSYSADERLPEDYFKGVMEEKAEMFRRYPEDVGDPFIFLSHCVYTMVTFQFYSYDDEDSLKMHYTFSNLGDLEDQLYFLWVQLNYLLKGELLSYWNYKISYIIIYKI